MTEGRVRYDDRTDSFVYEILDESGEWGMCMACPCVRREGAEYGEDASYIHFEMLKRVVFDADVYGVRLRLA